MLYHPCANATQVDLLRNIVTQCLRRHIITPYKLLSPDRVCILLVISCIQQRCAEYLGVEYIPKIWFVKSVSICVPKYVAYVVTKCNSFQRIIRKLFQYRPIRNRILLAGFLEWQIYVILLTVKDCNSNFGDFCSFVWFNSDVTTKWVTFRGSYWRSSFFVKSRITWMKWKSIVSVGYLIILIIIRNYVLVFEDLLYKGSSKKYIWSN